MKLTLTSLLGLAISVLAIPVPQDSSATTASSNQPIPPTSFGFPSAPNGTVLGASWLQPSGTYQKMSPGILYGVNIEAKQPVVGLQVSQYQSLSSWKGQYIVMMVDPDAKYPATHENRYVLHWLQLNMTVSSTDIDSKYNMAPCSRQLTSSVAAYSSFINPQPPTDSDSHRYTLYAFQQPSNFKIPANYAGYTGLNRTKFPLENFIRDAKLGAPAAANYAYVSNHTGVPSDFVAAPGGKFPAGN